MADLDLSVPDLPFGLVLCLVEDEKEPAYAVVVLVAGGEGCDLSDLVEDLIGVLGADGSGIACCIEPATFWEGPSRRVPAVDDALGLGFLPVELKPAPYIDPGAHLPMMPGGFAPMTGGARRTQAARRGRPGPVPTPHAPNDHTRPRPLPLSGRALFVTSASAHGARGGAAPWFELGLPGGLRPRRADEGLGDDDPVAVEREGRAAVQLVPEIERFADPPAEGGVVRASENAISGELLIVSHAAILRWPAWRRRDAFRGLLSWANAGEVIPRIFRERCRAAAFGGVWLHPA